MNVGVSHKFSVSGDVAGGGREGVSQCGGGEAEAAAALAGPAPPVSTLLHLVLLVMVRVA